MQPTGADPIELAEEVTEQKDLLRRLPMDPSLTTHASAPAPAPWRPSATSQSERCAWPGRPAITEASRLACRYMSRPFAILSLTHDLGRAAPIQLITGRVAREHDWPWIS